VAEPVDDGIFREIDEELRNEQFSKLWKRYGNLLIAGVVAMVAGVGGFQAWKNYDLKERGRQGEQFAASLDLADGKDSQAAIDQLSRLAADSGSGYAMLAGFQGAALLAKQGDRTAAIAAYGMLATDTSLDAIYRDLAVIFSVTQQINAGGADNGTLTALLAPLSADDNPWRHSARELLGVLAISSGDTAKAQELFKALSKDPTAPQGIRQRAGEMLSAGIG